MRGFQSRTGSLNIADSFSFYFASVGFYLYNVVTDLSMRIYAAQLHESPRASKMDALVVEAFAKFGEGRDLCALDTVVKKSG